MKRIMFGVAFVLALGGCSSLSVMDKESTEDLAKAQKAESDGDAGNALHYYTKAAGSLNYENGSSGRYFFEHSNEAALKGCLLSKRFGYAYARCRPFSWNGLSGIKGADLAIDKYNKLLSDPNPTKALIYATVANNADLAIGAIKAGADVNVIVDSLDYFESEGRNYNAHFGPVVWVAIRENNRKLIEALIDAGANINLRNEDKYNIPFVDFINISRVSAIPGKKDFHGLALGDFLADHGYIATEKDLDFIAATIDSRLSDSSRTLNKNDAEERGLFLGLYKKLLASTDEKTRDRHLNKINAKKQEVLMAELGREQRSQQERARATAKVQNIGQKICQTVDAELALSRTEKMARKVDVVGFTEAIANGKIRLRIAGVSADDLRGKRTNIDQLGGAIAIKVGAIIWDDPRNWWPCE